MVDGNLAFHSYASESQRPSQQEEDESYMSRETSKLMVLQQNVTGCPGIAHSSAPKIWKRS